MNPFHKSEKKLPSLIVPRAWLEAQLRNSALNRFPPPLLLASAYSMASATVNTEQVFRLP